MTKLLLENPRLPPECKNMDHAQHPDQIPKDVRRYDVQNCDGGSRQYDTMNDPCCSDGCTF